MSITNPALSELPDDERSVVENLLIDFDLNWHSTRLLDQILADTRSYGPDLQRAILAECVKIDLEKRWDQGDAIQLEWYLREMPVLGAAEDLPPDLIQAEFETRCRFERVRIEELRERFPRQADDLEHLIAQQIELAKPPESGEVVQPDPIPTRFGRYRIRRKIGDGGMGQVFLAWDTKLEREMAIKIPHANESLELADRLQREAATAARLRHRSICPVYDVGVIEGRQFIAMAYIEGETLADKLRRTGPISHDETLRIMAEVASAAEHAHQQGIIHRDLKPSNIVIEPDGTAVVTDFGLAQMLDQPNIMVTPANTPVGTPAYMAPEQIRGNRDAIGPPTDVYGLGSVMYEMLTGRVPFTGSYSEVIADAIRVEPVPPSRLRADTPPDLERICLKALAKEPADRYPTAQMLIDALGIDRTVPSAATTTKATPSSLRWIPLLAAAAIVLVGGYALTRPNEKPNQNRGPVVESSATEEFEPIAFPNVVVVAGRAELLAAVAGSVPYTEIRIAPGRYEAVYHRELDGQTPLKFTAVDPDDPPVFVGSSQPPESGTGLAEDETFGLMFSMCQDIYVSNLRFESARAMLDFEDCERVSVTNCEFRSVESEQSTGVNFKRVKAGYIGDCRLTDWNEGNGILARSSLACVFANNVLLGSPDDNDDIDNAGLSVLDGSLDCHILGNTINGFESSIVLGGRQTDSVQRHTNSEASRIVVRDNLLANSLSAIWFNSATDCVFERNTVRDPQYGLLRFVKDAVEFPCRNVVRNNLFLYESTRSTVICSPGIPCELRIDMNHWQCPSLGPDSIPYVDDVRFEPQEAGPIACDENGLLTQPGDFGRQNIRVTELPPSPASVPGTNLQLLRHPRRALATSNSDSDAI